MVGGRHSDCCRCDFKSCLLLKGKRLEERCVLPLALSAALSSSTSISAASAVESCGVVKPLTTGVGALRLPLPACQYRLWTAWYCSCCHDCWRRNCSVQYALWAICPGCSAPDIAATEAVKHEKSTLPTKVVVRTI